MCFPIGAVPSTSRTRAIEKLESGANSGQQAIQSEPKEAPDFHIGEPFMRIQNRQPAISRKPNVGQQKN
jgi:hypothetical protein